MELKSYVETKEIINYGKFIKNNIVIPELQRNFVWSSPNIKAFLDSLEESFLYNSKPYIGNIFIFKEENENDDNQLIDGQQRLMTLMIFAKVLRNLGVQKAERFYRLENFDGNDYFVLLRNKDEEVNKILNLFFLGNKKYPSIMSPIMEYYRSRLDSAEKTINNWINKNIKNEEKSLNYLFDILKNIELSYTVTTKKEIAHKLYKDLNLVSKPLSSGELIKNDLTFMSNQILLNENIKYLSSDNWLHISNYDARYQYYLMRNRKKDSGSSYTFEEIKRNVYGYFNEFFLIDDIDPYLSNLKNFNDLENKFNLNNEKNDSNSKFFLLINKFFGFKSINNYLIYDFEKNPKFCKAIAYNVILSFIHSTLFQKKGSTLTSIQNETLVESGWENVRKIIREKYRSSFTDIDNEETIREKIELFISSKDGNKDLIKNVYWFALYIYTKGEATMKSKKRGHIKIDITKLTYEHIDPKSKNGDDSFDNGGFLTKEYNGEAGNDELDEKKKIYNSDDFIQIIKADKQLEYFNLLNYDEIKKELHYEKLIQLYCDLIKSFISELKGKKTIQRKYILKIPSRNVDAIMIEVDGKFILKKGSKFCLEPSNSFKKEVSSRFIKWKKLKTKYPSGIVGDDFEGNSPSELASICWASPKSGYDSWLDKDGNKLKR